jgi:hypothetical protein
MTKQLLLAGLLAISLTMSAQYKPMLFGLRAGGSLDWMKPDAEQYSNQGVRPGFSWGFIADFFVMENYAVETGFNVQYLYGKLDYPSRQVIGGDTLDGSLTRFYKLQYIQIPILWKMQASISEEIKLHGKIGIGTAFRLRAKADDSFTSDGGSPTESSGSITDEVGLIRESFLIGGGVAVGLGGSTTLIAELTFDNGFNNILKGNNTLDTELKHKAVISFVELGVGIIF